MKDMFVIPLHRGKNLKVYVYPVEMIKEDMKANKFEKPLQLSDYDWKVFSTKKSAEAWLERYNEILKNLNNKKICKSRDLPAILYKRRYIVQTLMGEKNQTNRSYDKKEWKPGMLFNLHDQVFFLTVKLISKTKKGTKDYCYKFKVMK